jgi:hypothetical protein
MPDAEGSKDQNRLAAPHLDPEDHPEFAVRRREPHLHAMPEGGSVWSLLVASEEFLSRHPQRLKLSTSCERHFLPAIARSSQILRKGRIVK